MKRLHIKRELPFSVDRRGQPEEQNPAEVTDTTMVEPTSSVDIPDMPDPIVQRNLLLSEGDLPSLRVVQIKVRLREAGLSVSGVKSILIEQSQTIDVRNAYVSPSAKRLVSPK